MLDTTTYINPRGRETIQLFQRPGATFLEPFYTNYEKNYDVDMWHVWSQDTWPAVPGAICVVYLVAIFGGKYYMAVSEANK